MAVLQPMPRQSVRTATRVKTFDRWNWRREYLMSWANVLIMRVGSCEVSQGMRDCSQYQITSVKDPSVRMRGQRGAGMTCQRASSNTRGIWLLFCKLLCLSRSKEVD